VRAPLLAASSPLAASRRRAPPSLPVVGLLLQLRLLAGAAVLQGSRLRLRRVPRAVALWGSRLRLRRLPSAVALPESRLRLRLARDQWVALPRGSVLGLR